MKKYLTMEEILDRLQEWKENTDIDIKTDWIEESKRADYIRQSISLAQCIGLLSTLGENGNIKQSDKSKIIG